MIVPIRTLMLVDDDEDDREIFLTVIGKVRPGLLVSVATNGEEALQDLQNSGSSPDFIFLDLNMPLMNGRQFMQAIKGDAKLQQIPVAILSTSSDARTISEMKALGAKHFITKPDKYSTWEKVLNDFFTNPPL